MKRVGILTFHSANNFGALLQAVSLQKTIVERWNLECELIDYDPEFIRKDYSISPFKNKHPKAIIKSTLRIPDKIKRNSKFHAFRKKIQSVQTSVRVKKTLGVFAIPLMRLL